MAKAKSDAVEPVVAVEGSNEFKETIEILKACESLLSIATSALEDGKLNLKDLELAAVAMRDAKVYIEAVKGGNLVLAEFKHPTKEALDKLLFAVFQLVTKVTSIKVKKGLV